MNFNFHQLRRNLGVLISLVSISLGCGVDFHKPELHFDGVDEKGHLMYIEEFDQIDFGERFKLPLVGIFKSNREYKSPTLGYGWMLGLLDSHFVALSENKFQMVQPDGWILEFNRSSSQEQILNESSGWKAEIAGNRITAYASCGWKLVFEKGKIIEIQNPESRTLSYDYKDGVLEQIREGQKVVLRVESDPFTHEIKSYTYNDKTVEVTMDKRPRVQEVAGQRVVSAVESAVSGLKYSDGTERKFEYAVNKSLEPTMKVLGKDKKIEREFTWNPITKLITKDNDWTYTITPSEYDWVNAKIERKNSKKQNEMWWVDQRKGFEKWSKIDGRSLERSWFTSGILAGFERSSSQVGKDGVRYDFLNYYNEKAQLISRSENGNVYNYEYQDEIRKVFTGNNKIYEEKRDLNNRQIELIDFQDKKKVVKQFNEFVTLVEVTKDSGNVISYEIDKKNNKLIVR